MRDLGIPNKIIRLVKITNNGIMIEGSFSNQFLNNRGLRMGDIIVNGTLQPGGKSNKSSKNSDKRFTTIFNNVQHKVKKTNRKNI